MLGDEKMHRLYLVGKLRVIATEVHTFRQLFIFASQKETPKANSRVDATSAYQLAESALATSKSSTTIQQLTGSASYEE